MRSTQSLSLTTSNIWCFKLPGLEIRSLLCRNRNTRFELPPRKLLHRASHAFADHGGRSMVRYFLLLSIILMFRIWETDPDDSDSVSKYHVVFPSKDCALPQPRMSTFPSKHGMLDIPRHRLVVSTHVGVPQLRDAPNSTPEPFVLQFEIIRNI